MKIGRCLCLGFTVLLLPFSTVFAASPQEKPAVTIAGRPSPRSIRSESKKRRWEDSLRSNFTYDAHLSRLYHSDLYGLSIRYPGAWQVEEVLDRDGDITTVVLFLSPMEKDDIAQENVNLVVEDISATRQTLDQYTANAIRQERELFRGYVLRTSAPLQMAGLPAHMVSYDAQFGGKTLSFEQVWILRDGKVYVWTLAATPETFEQFSQMLREMVNTFSFRPR